MDAWLLAIALVAFLVMAHMVALYGNNENVPENRRWFGLALLAFVLFAYAAIYRWGADIEDLASNLFRHQW